MWSRSLLILVSCVWLELCWSTIPAAEPLHVMSYNIRYANPQDGEDVWSARRDTVAATLSAADICGLQEVLVSQLNDLRERLPQWDWYGVGRDDGTAQGEMVPIGFRKERLELLDKGTFWLSAQPTAVGKPGWDAALPRIASWARLRDRVSSAEFLFLNTHFDHRGKQARAESGALLRTWLAEHRQALPVIVTGDFNAQLSDQPLMNLLMADRSAGALVLQDARSRAAKADTGPTGTWNAFKKIAEGSRIDHILVAAPITVDEFLTLDPRTSTGRFGSDHLPISARVQLPTQAADPQSTNSSKRLRNIDLDAQTARQTVIDREPGQYLGHPTTVLLEDGRTIICVYPKGHGRGPIVMKRSDDGGRTWSPRLPVPDNWSTSQETPTIHRVVAADGTKRLIVFSGLYPIRMASSTDDGRSWTPLEPIGKFGGIVAMGSVVGLKTPGHYLALFHDDGRFLRGSGKVAPEFQLLKTFSRDGGLTWGEPEVIYAASARHLCEPGAIRSPDGRQIAVLLRENRRVEPSHIIFSDDEGQSWTAPRPLPASLTGDRHTGKYAADGRLLISFRDVPARGQTSESAGDWVAWVGTYDDLVQGREGQYRVRLKDNLQKSDCAYPGVEILPDDTFVLTTYGHWAAGEQPYILSVRLKLAELDEQASR